MQTSFVFETNANHVLICTDQILGQIGVFTNLLRLFLFFLVPQFFLGLFEVLTREIICQKSPERMFDFDHIWQPLSNWQ